MSTDLHNRTDDMLHLRVPPEMRAALEREAARSERTLSQQVRYLLGQVVALEAKPPAAKLPPHWTGAQDGAQGGAA